MQRSPYNGISPWTMIIAGIIGFSIYRWAHAEKYLLPTASNQPFTHMKMVYAEPGDTLSDIANEYGIDVAVLKAANPGIAHPPRAWSLIAIPEPALPKTSHTGIIINTAARKLYLYPKSKKEVLVFPVAVGRNGWETPIGKSTVIKKQKDPVWFVPESIQEHMDEKGIFLPDVVEPGPSNPLGKYAIRTGFSHGTILIHGTNAPDSIGRPVSSGCIRMFNEHVEQVFHHVDVGTPIEVIHEPVLTQPVSVKEKTNWIKEKLTNLKSTASKIQHNSLKAVTANRYGHDQDSEEVHHGA